MRATYLILTLLCFTFNASHGIAATEMPVADKSQPVAVDALLAATDPVQVVLDGMPLPSDWVAEPAASRTDLHYVQLPQPQSSLLLAEFKCQSILFKRFKRTQRAVDVFIYNFPDARAAFGAYSTMRIGSSNVITRGDASSEDDQNICFLKGSRFVTVHATAEDDEVSKRTASTIADYLAANIDEHADPPSLLNTLPVLDRMPGTERVFMGPIAVRKYMAIPFIPALQSERAIGIAFADYQFPHPEPDRLKAMVLDYGDSRLAATIYNDYSARVAAVQKARPLSTAMQLSKGQDAYMVCGHVRTRLFIIAGAHRKLSPLVLARQLAY